MISEVVKNQLKTDHPKATEADLNNLVNAMKASEKKHLAGVASSEQLDQHHKDVAEKGRKVILTSVRQGAELTREVFNIIRACEGPDYVEATFKLAEAWAIKALREGQPEGERPIKNLADIAKIQGGAGASSYVTTKSRLIKYMKDADEMVEKLQRWYDFQAKHDGEPQMFVQEEFLNPWSKRYADEKRGWSQFTRDARLAEQCAATLKTRQDALERAKGKDAAAHTGRNGEQHVQGLVSGGRMRETFPDSTIAVWNALVKATHSAMDELDHEIINGVLSTAVSTLQGLMEAKRNEIKARVAETSSRPSSGIAAADAPRGGDATESNAEQSSQDRDGIVELVKPEWIRAEDWDGATIEDKHTMIDAGREAYEEERTLMEQAGELADAGSNEPTMEVRTADEPPPNVKKA